MPEGLVPPRRDLAGTSRLIRSVHLQHALYRAAKADRRSRRFHALATTRSTAGTCYGGRGSDGCAPRAVPPGVDGVSTLAQVEEQGAGELLGALRAELETRSYRPLPVRRVTIPKSSGGERHLGVPAVRDRVVQAAAKLVCEPLFEADFLDCSYGFRRVS